MQRFVFSFYIILFTFCLTQVRAQNFDFVNKMTSPDVSFNDQVGRSCAVSGDYAIFGAYRNSGVGFESGSAYIARKNSQNGSWVFAQQLAPSDAASDDWFGWEVDISGTRAIVGLPKSELGDGVTGAAYIYELFGTTWIQIAKLIASDEEISDGFGGSVSISGDYAAVSAIGDDDFGSNTGAAYIFHFNGANWNEEAKLTPSDPSDFSGFGVNLSISSETLIVGAIGDDTNGAGAGAAYIFDRNLGTWTQNTKLLASDGEQSDDFGYHVAISGDYAIVGAPDKKKFGWNFVGAAYVFERVGGVWIAKQKLLASDYAQGDQFGWSVDIDSNQIIVGARDKDGISTLSSGAAYIFERNGTWSETHKLIAQDADNGDYFGYSVSISGEEAIVGAVGEESSGQLSGSVYFFGNSSVELTEELALSAHVYPNPVDNLLKIDLQNNTPLNYKITGSLGEVIISGELSCMHTEIELGNLTSGMYFLEISAEDGVFDKKLIKQ